ncbi:MAG: PAS domain-containing protein, partial [Microcoleaceae cyanobacterium]
VTYIATLDDLSTKLYVSPRIQKMLGFSATEWQQKSDLWLKQIHPEDCQRVLVDLYLSQNSGKPFCCEYRLLAKSGYVVWVHDEASLVRDDKGNLISFQGVMFDISEHIQLEKALSNTQIFLSSIVENLPVSVFVKNAENLSFCLWNKTCENMFGYSADAVLSKSDGQVFPPEQAKAFIEQDRQVLQKRELLEIACESVATLNHGVRSLHTKKIPLIDEKTNQITYLLGISEDITEKVEAENALRTSEAKNRALINAIPDLMYCIDAEGVLTEYMVSKDQLSKSSELSENNYLHKNITEVFSSELADWIMHHVKEALVSGKVQRGEYMQELDGQWHCYDARFFAIHRQATAENILLNIPPAEQQVLVIVRDISENKQLA